MKTQTISLIIGSLATLWIPAGALADPVNITPQQVGNVEYVTGGIGDEERTAIEAVKNNYNLHVTSAGADGAYVGNTHLSILDSANTSILESDTGPLFYAKLADGTYTVEGSHNNQTKSQKIKISGNKSQTVTFSWK